jgi:thiol-disulfide isomerase/thioredoxin
MKIARGIAWGGLLVVLATSNLLAQDRVQWLSDVDEARQVAAQTSRLVLVHFYTDWCEPCHHLERSVFNQPEFIRALNLNYVPVKLNAERHEQMANLMGADRFPTDVVISPDGKQIYRTVSPQDVNQYISMLDQISANNRVHPQASVAHLPQLYSNPNLAGGPHQLPATSPFAGPNHAGNSPPQFSPSTNSPANMYQNPSQQNPSAGLYLNQPGTTFSSPLNSSIPPQQATIRPFYADQVTPSRGAASSSFGPPGNVPFAATQPSFNQAEFGVPHQIMPPNQFGTFFPPGIQTPPSSPVPSVPIAPPTFQPQEMTNPYVGDLAGPAPPSMVHQSPQSAPYAGNVLSSQLSAPQDQTTVEAQLPAGGPALALDGQCPVTLVEASAWQPGDRRWGAVHRNRTYLFAGEREQQQFLADPDRYSPVLSGYDPVKYIRDRKLADGRREHGVMFQKSIYLFESEDTLNEFWKLPDYYAAEVQKIMQDLNAAAR